MKTFPGKVFILTGILVSALLGCLDGSQNDPEALYKTWCGSCHVAPLPAELPRSIWEKKVLPEMAARLGIKIQGYNPLAKASIAESFIIQQMGVYPEKPLLSQEKWEKIQNYILANAPDSLENIPLAGKRSQPLTQFLPTPVSLDGRPAAYMTYMAFDDSLSTLYAGNVFGEVFRWKLPAKPELLHLAALPVMDYAKSGDTEFITQIGIMQPNEQIRGQMNISRPNEQTQILDSLHRPVHTLVNDLNGDGKDEMLVSEYGNYSGKLTLLVPSGKTFERKTLFAKAGVVRTIAADMNNDQKTDIVFLSAQGDEGVFILFQEKDLTFSLKNVLQFSPVYGSSWFELTDYDGDGDKDIITANGDNADFSVTPKPYHGVRIFINDGENNFAEKFFFPMYGATRIIARDFDKDNDMDLAVVSFFPEPKKAPGENFVYLQNENSSNFTFTAYTTELSTVGRWLVMDAGDYDGDGDSDIILGSFYSVPRSNVPEVSGGVETEIPDLLILQNHQTRDSE
ncbi:MAG: VCBS repeat-containing protein [Bacteroidia bacterium]|nr:VCBS repeat-containing protein [Bacteroidia bacterium]